MSPDAPEVASWTVVWEKVKQNLGLSVEAPDYLEPEKSGMVLALAGSLTFKDAAGDFADNVVRTLSTVDTARQIQLGVRFVF